MVIKRRRIAIDIDDVLSDFTEAFIEYSNATYGTSYKAEDYTEDLQKLWGVDGEEVGRRIIELNRTGLAATLGHKDHAKRVLEVLKKDYDLLIITFRIPEIKDMTMTWVEERFPGVFDQDKVYFTGLLTHFNDTAKMPTKGDLAKELGADYLIDDQIKHCLSAAEMGIKSLLFGPCSWDHKTKLPENIVHVNDWLEVEKFFNEERK